MKRVIPVLLFSGHGLYKTKRFKRQKYVGDVINTVRLFNDLGADEIIVLDIDATKSRGSPNFELVEVLAPECFMPVTYGGGIRSISDAERILRLGVEKISINTTALSNTAIISEFAHALGSSTLVVSVDVKLSVFRKWKIYSHVTNKLMPDDLGNYLSEIEDRGAGEILLTNVNREGTRSGLDLELISQLNAGLTVPVVVSGGCGTFEDISEAFKLGVSGVACGAMFVYNGPHEAVLVNYLSEDEYLRLNS